MLKQGEYKLHIMKKFLGTLFTLCIISTSLQALPSAASPAKSTLDNQVNFLIQRMHESECTFVKNGNVYTKKQAASYLKNKWDYAKDGISSVDMFINTIGSSCWFTGREYQVNCNEKITSSRRWLTHELSFYKQVG